MSQEFDRAVFTAKEFRLDLTVSGNQVTDFGFKTVTIPGISEADTEDVKLNNATKRIVVSPGVAENFELTTVAVDNWFAWRAAAQASAPYIAVLSGINGGWAGDKLTISGQIMSCASPEIGVDGVAEITFTGQTDFFSYEAAQNN